MKYRRIPSKKHYIKRVRYNRKRLCVNRDCRLRLYRHKGDPINFSSVFEQNRLGRGRRTGLFLRMRARFARAGVLRNRIVTFLSTKIKRAYTGVAVLLKRLFLAIGRGFDRWRRTRKEPKDMHILAGALVGSLAVSVVSAFAVLYALFFSEFFGRYERVSVPEIIGMSADEAVAALDGGLYSLTLNYEYSTSVPEGCVISQVPSAGAERKVYLRGEPCSVNVTVSLGKQLTELADYTGRLARDACLELKNAAFSVAIVELDDPLVPAGQVLSTSPLAGSMIESGGLVVLTVSRGEERRLLTVPDVCGLTEASAIAKIRASGFIIGDIDYKTSNQTAGLVIAQDRRAAEKAPEGVKISITVSAGHSYPDKTMPSLYGLSIAEAKEKLAEHGLVVGNIYAVDGSEPSGSVIAHSPSAGSTISPSVVSVDMYVSR